MKRLTTETIRSLGGMFKLENEWRRLESESGTVLPFAHWDWAVSWWIHLRECKLGVEDSLFIQALRDESGELCAVAPMMLTRRPAVGPLAVRHLHFFGADPNITEIRGLLTKSHLQLDAHRALFAQLRASADEWDWLLLSGLPADGGIAEFASDIHSEVQWLPDIHDFVLPIPSSWEELRARLPRNIKESLRKCYNSLQRDGHDYTVEVVRERSDVVSALADFFVLHEARAEVSDTIRHANVFATTMAQRFLVDVCERFANRDALRIFRLRIRDRVAAIRIGFVVGDVLYLYYSGYNLDYAKYSVMTTTVAEAIKYAIEHRFRAVNLSTGNDVSKTRWRPDSFAYRQAMIPSPSRHAGWAQAAYQLTRRAAEKAPIRNLLSKLAARRVA